MFIPRRSQRPPILCQNEDIMGSILDFTGFSSFVQLGRTCTELRVFTAEICCEAIDDPDGFHIRLHTNKRTGTLFDIEYTRLAIDAIAVSVVLKRPMNHINFEAPENSPYTRGLLRLMRRLPSVECLRFANMTFQNECTFPPVKQQLTFANCDGHKVYLGAQTQLKKLYISDSGSIDSRVKTFPPNLESLIYNEHGSRSNAICLPENVCIAVRTVRTFVINCGKIQDLHHIHHLTNLKRLFLKVKVLSDLNAKAISGTYKTLETLHIHSNSGSLDLKTFSKLRHLTFSGSPDLPELPLQLQSLCCEIRNGIDANMAHIITLPNLQKLTLDVAYLTSGDQVRFMARRIVQYIPSLKELEVNRYSEMFAAEANRTFTVARVYTWNGVVYHAT